MGCGGRCPTKPKGTVNLLEPGSCWAGAGSAALLLGFTVAHSHPWGSVFAHHSQPVPASCRHPWVGSPDREASSTLRGLGGFCSEGRYLKPHVGLFQPVKYILRRNIHLMLYNKLKINTRISLKPHFYEMGVETFLDVFSCRSQFALVLSLTTGFNLSAACTWRHENKLMHMFHVQEFLPHSPWHVSPEHTAWTRQESARSPPHRWPFSAWLVLVANCGTVSIVFFCWWFSFSTVLTKSSFK